MIAAEFGRTKAILCSQIQQKRCEKLLYTPNCAKWCGNHVLRRYGPDPDKVIGEATEQGLTISRPGDGNTLGFPGVGTNINEVGLELVNDGPEEHRCQYDLTG